MKYWWRNVVKDYFAFTAKERNGLITMLFIAAAIFFAFRYYPVKRSPVSKTAFQQELVKLKITADSSHSNKDYQRNENFADYTRPKNDEYSGNSKGKLFDFDPNTLDTNGWKRLGIREKTIHTIQNFLAKGFKFRHPEDIKKVYGLSPKDTEKLIPYIHIAQEETFINGSFSNRDKITYSTVAGEPKKTRIININTADTSAFIALPGIGNKLAARIVSFRQKLGGFSSVAQLGETYGIPDSTYQKIKKYLQCDNPALKTININTADVNELRTHPYLRWNIANAIINYRQQHGNYKTVDDLRKIDIITDDLYNKIAPYLVI